MCQSKGALVLAKDKGQNMQRNVRQVKRKRKKRKRKNSSFIFLYILLFILLFILVICITVTTCIVIGNRKNSEEYAPSTTSQTEHSERNTDSNSKDDSRENANEEDWCLILVNKWNPIAESNNIEITELSNGERVDKRIYPYLQKMFDSAQNDGVYPIVASGYRTEQEQREIYNDKFADYKAEGLSDLQAEKETELWVAIPNTSEHQLGLAVDINADGIHSAGTQVYEWLKNNAHLYGFINRYPSDKTNITGVTNEPWHYRYVGVKAATEIYNQDICFEEYLGKVN